MDDKRLAERLDVERPTVTRWRNYPGRLSLPAIQGIADALGLEGPADLFRHPKRPSIDAMLANDPDELHARARAMIGILKSTGT